MLLTCRQLVIDVFNNLTNANYQLAALAQCVDGMAQCVDCMAQRVDGMAQRVDCMAQCVDGMAQCVVNVPPIGN